MMRYFIIWLFCSNVFLSVLAQNTYFCKTYGQNLEDMGFALSRTYDHGFILMGTSTKYDINSNATIRKIDSLGAELWAYDIGFNGSYEIPVGAVELQDSSILTAIWSDATNTKLRQVKFSKDGNILLDTNYYLSNGFPDINVLEIQMLPDGRIITPSIQNDSTLICFWWNQYGDTLFSKEVYNNLTDVNTNKISLSKAFVRGTSIIFCIRNDSPQPAPWTVIRTTDLNGNIIDSTSFQDPFLSGCSYSFGFGSKLFIYYPSMNSTQINYAQFDISGDTLINPQTCLESGYKLSGIGADYTDSLIYVCGKRQENLNDTTKALLIKLDTNGVVQWFKTYLPYDYDKAYLQSVNYFPDCIAAIGTAWNSSDPDSVDIFFVKANLNGSLTNIADHDPYVNSINLFPNPAVDIIHFDLQLYDEAEYEITDMLGKRVETGLLNSNIINVSDLIPGFYLLRIYDGEINYRARFIKE